MATRGNDNGEAVHVQTEGRAAWIAPKVTPMPARDAEDGLDPNIADGILTYS